MLIKNVFRGTHGGDIKGRSPNTYFSTEAVARIYALSPNDANDLCVNPRVYQADITITKPLVNNPHDPFITAVALVIAIGEENTRTIYLEQEAWVCSTDMWRELQATSGLSYSGMMSKTNWLLFAQVLDVQLYPLLDNPKYMAWFKEAGYDGAIYNGSGVGGGSPEYCVFDFYEQVNSTAAYIPQVEA